MLAVELARRARHEQRRPGRVRRSAERRLQRTLVRAACGRKQAAGGPERSRGLAKASVGVGAGPAAAFIFVRVGQRARRRWATTALGRRAFRSDARPARQITAATPLR